jgi:hypothetical protein
LNWFEQIYWQVDALFSELPLLEKFRVSLFKGLCKRLLFKETTSIHLAELNRLQLHVMASL